jgi:16S rRNA (uracil1498-N3)-methyltransferase
MRRFFIHPDQIAGRTVTLIGPEAHHLVTVLRLRAGDEVEFCDGSGLIHRARLEKLGREVTAVVLASHREQDASSLPLILAQCLLKGKKMDLVVQKATELGVHTLIPVQSRFAIAGGDPVRQASRMARWQRIVVAACKQCGRATPMRIMPVTTISDLPVQEYAYRICCLETDRDTLLSPEFFSGPGPVLLLIGPEGGFHGDEVRFIEECAFHRITLGPLILRAETAAIVACGLVRYLAALSSAGPACGVLEKFTSKSPEAS